jgi:TetR/AcrR family transcriptional regulator, cholesterol catabolism regulator
VKKPKAEPERQENKGEILQVARRLFLEKGYGLTTMSHIAAEAGVAPNTIYWYFADKDALLIAVLDALVADAARDFQARLKGSLEGQITWLLGEFDRLHNMITTVHSRASASEALGKWHDNFHRVLEAGLIAALRRHGVREDDLAPASRVLTFVVEGLLVHPSSAKDRRALVRWVVQLVSRQGSEPEP